MYSVIIADSWLKVLLVCGWVLFLCMWGSTCAHAGLVFRLWCVVYADFLFADVFSLVLICYLLCCFVWFVVCLFVVCLSASLLLLICLLFGLVVICFFRGVLVCLVHLLYCVCGLVCARLFGCLFVCYWFVDLFVCVGAGSCVLFVPFVVAICLFVVW